MAGEKEMTTLNVYRLGGIGAGGHWFGRLHPFLKHRMRLHKAVGITRFEDKKELLEGYELTPERYFQVVPGGRIPDDFFQGLNAVHVASHNQFHYDQTIQALENDLPTVVEKALGVNEAQFNEMVSYIKSNKHHNRVVPHLHYLDKALTIDLKEKLLPDALKEYGRIKLAVGTFFEDICEEDLRRQWLFRPENGGIFMDWIHPSTILSHACGGHYESLESVENYVVNPAYDAMNPTAVTARFKIRGDAFASNAQAVIRVGKGFPTGTRHKRMRLYFEKGAVLDLTFVDSEKEFTQGLKGSWMLRVGNEMKNWGSPSGRSSYEHLVDKLLMMVEGGKSPIPLEEIIRLYKPVWFFHEASKKEPLITDKEKISDFTEKGLKNEA